MEINASRAAARTHASGEPILLLEQDRTRWDQILIRRGLAALAHAEALGRAPGPYLLQASIAACHARARAPEETDWKRIADLYGELSALVRSPVVELNRALAVSMADGPAAGLTLIDALSSAPSLQNYHLLPSARADLLCKLGRFREAQAEFERAANLTRTPAGACRLGASDCQEKLAPRSIRAALVCRPTKASFGPKSGDNRRGKHSHERQGSMRC